MAVRPTRPDAEPEPHTRAKSAGRIDFNPLWQVFRRRMADAGWYLRRSRAVWWAGFGVFGLLFIMHVMGYVLSGDIMPRVSAMGVEVGGLSTEDAATALESAWEESATIKLMLEGELYRQVPPSDLGIQLDAMATARNADRVGLDGLFVSRSVPPVVSVDYITAQNFLLGVADEINMQPQNASFRLVGSQVVSVPGQVGTRLDTTLSLDALNNDPVTVVEGGEFDLLMTDLPPDVRDGSAYVEDVEALVAQPFELRGFDPVSNQIFTWPIDSETFIQWLEAGMVTPTLRENAFLPYVDLINETLNPEGENLRYVSPVDAIEKLEEAIANRANRIDVRVRRRPTVHTVRSGDRGFGIARQTGIPFYMIQRANSGVDMDVLSTGQLLNIPSPDEVMPEDPVPNKRIVVDLDNQYLMAFEDGQIVFEWAISSGVSDAPTSPGVYQILNKQEEAWGSSSTLCDSAGLVCGQWRMSWFMGIYEVSPGLINGFHGEVLLPNGNLLGGGTVGYRATFGCVMSVDEQAKLLYDWAEIGTPVEIISNEFRPKSDLGRYVWDLLRNNNA